MDLKEFCRGKGCYINYDIISQFHEEHGYKFLLKFIDGYNDLIQEIKAIQRAVQCLEKWKKEEWFKFNETVYEINFYNCDRANEQNLITKVTLPKARKMLKESLIRYETLNSIFADMKRNFSVDLDEYFNEEG